MKITGNAQVLHVSGIEGLTAANANKFQSELMAALGANVEQIELDLSQASFMDCGGIGALVSLRNSARKRNGGITIRVLNPSAPAQQMLELTRMNDAFVI